MDDPVGKAADYLHAELDKLGTFLDHSACLYIVRYLHHLWDNKSLKDLPRYNIAQNGRQRYEGENWDNGAD